MRPMVIIDPETMKWSPLQEGPSSGIMAKILSTDEETGALTGIGKLPAGSSEPKHSHPCSCDILILQGKMINTETGQEISKGMYWHIPRGELHGPLRIAEDEDCIIFIMLDGPFSTLIAP
jgi:quercetin dioxygenase-like cupin family protein